MSRKRILICEDEGIVAQDIKARLSDLGYSVPATVSSGNEVIPALKKARPDLVLMDIMLQGDADGIDAADQIRELYDIPVIYLTAYSDTRTLDRAKLTEPYGYILKPFEDKELRSTIEMALYRHRMERKLREKEQWLATTLKSIGDGVITADTQSKITFMNPVAEVLTGWPAEQAIGRDMDSVYQIVDETTRKRGKTPLPKSLMDSSAVSFNSHTLLVSRDGSERPVSETAAPIQNDIGDVIGLVVVIRDITERKRIEDALEDQRERLAVTLRSIGEGVITTDTTGKIQLINQIGEELTGWTLKEARNRPINKVFQVVDERTDAPVPDPVGTVLTEGETGDLSQDMVLIHKNGERRLIAECGAPIRDQRNEIIGVVIVFRDITKMKELEAELLKKQKLESVGVLAGGIAHDFNNILTGILGNISVSRYLSDTTEPVFKHLREAEKACIKAQDLTRQLLTFAKGGAPIRKTSSLSELISESAIFALRGSRTQHCFSIAKDLWPANIDVGQISQVINNLVINADQAMPDGGVITITAANISIETSKTPALKDGDYIKITVKDNGVGIAPGHLQKIFDPYFTTKQKGSGLGLAICYSIITRHDGYITALSEIGLGTTFYIYLPASPAAIPDEKKKEQAIIHGSGRILVLDDDQVVINLVQELLPEIGYSVDTATDGGRAIDMFNAAARRGEPYDVLILDLTIPGGMGGVDVIKTLLAVDPATKAIVSSGYSNDPVLAEYQKYGFSDVMIKPYDVAEISGRLHRLIAATQGEED